MLAQVLAVVVALVGSGGAGAWFVSDVVSDPADGLPLGEAQAGPAREPQPDDGACPGEADPSECAPMQDEAGRFLMTQGAPLAISVVRPTLLRFEMPQTLAFDASVYGDDDSLLQRIQVGAPLSDVRSRYGGPLLDDRGRTHIVQDAWADVRLPSSGEFVIYLREHRGHDAWVEVLDPEGMTARILATGGGTLQTSSWLPDQRSFSMDHHAPVVDLHMAVWSAAKVEHDVTVTSDAGVALRYRAHPGVHDTPMRPELDLDPDALVQGNYRIEHDATALDSYLTLRFVTYLR